MLRNPASDATLRQVWTSGFNHSLETALRLVYELGAGDAKIEMVREIAGDFAEPPDSPPASDSPSDPVAPPDDVLPEGSVVATIDGPSGPDAPFVPTSVTPE